MNFIFIKKFQDKTADFQSLSPEGVKNSIKANILIGIHEVRQYCFLQVSELF